MDDLIAFLMARYAEDWSAARELVDGLDESRATREVEAKRAILDACEWVTARKADGGGIETDYQFRSGQVNALETAVQTLAAVYSDHPDYRQEWKP
jgi:hypothetical protein